MQSRLNAVLQFGLVSIPVGVCTAIKEVKTPLRTMHRECNTPLNQQMFCATCERNVEKDEQGKGIESEPGKFIYVEDDELEKLSAGRSRTITLTKFVDKDDISPVMVNKTYWLAPARDMSQPYSLFLKALKDSGKVGLGICTLWGVERPCRIGIEAGTLCIQTLYCWDEFVIPDVEAIETDAAQQKLAAQIIKQMSGRINLIEDLVSESRENIVAYIDAKKAGMTIAFDETERPKPEVNLMEALKTTLAEKQTAADKNKPRKPATRKKAVSK